MAKFSLQKSSPTVQRGQSADTLQQTSQQHRRYLECNQTTSLTLLHTGHISFCFSIFVHFYTPFAFSPISLLHRLICLYFPLNTLNAELNPFCHLLALLGVHHFLHVSRIRVKSLTLRLLMSHIYMEQLFLMFLDHTQRRTTVGRTPLDE